MVFKRKKKRLQNFDAIGLVKTIVVAVFSTLGTLITTVIARRELKGV